MFADFRPELLEAMTKEDIARHYHFWSITMETYNNSDEFKKIFKIISTDTYQPHTEPYVNIFEGHVYPMYGIIFHPEY